MRISVIVATLGRPEVVAQLLDSLATQTRAPAQVVLSVTSPGDLPSDLPEGAVVLTGSKGLPAQRNRGLEAALTESDLIAFFDDDYLPSSRALEGIAAFFEAHPDIAGANGVLLADGINSAGVSFEDAVALVREHDARSAEPARVLHELPNGLYGCNMVYRTAAIGEVRFDETLPLYGWQEDLDFSVQVGRRGRLVKSSAFTGVHRGVKGGRTSGLKLGYSQVANPIYLCRKGTMTWKFGLSLLIRNLIANHVKVFAPEPWVDRKGRLEGNWIALGHLMANRLSPMHIVDM